jgi:hypothetical protein
MNQICHCITRRAQGQKYENFNAQLEGELTF